MYIHSIPIRKCFVTYFTRVNKIVWEMHALNVVDQVVLSGAGFMANSAFKVA